MMSRTRPALLAASLLAAALVLSAHAAAQGEQQLKPFKEWTKEDAERMLSNSPWAQTQRMAGDVLDATGEIGMGVGITGPPRTLTLRLRSAATVRLAFLRLRQLRAKYDRMSEAQQAEFNLKNQALVECQPCADNYIVTLAPGPGRETGVPIALHTVALEVLRRNVRLADDRGEERELVHVERSKVSGGEVTFFFARHDKKGQPLLTPSSRKLIVTFTQEMTDAPASLSRYEFDVSKMLVGGKVVF
jgi:hypothetical protein